MVRRLRRAKGLTQEDCARHLHVSVQQFGKYERGENRFSAERFEQLRGLLGPELITQHGFGEFPQQPYVSALETGIREIFARIERDVEDWRAMLGRLLAKG